jgi:hypothetical protein
VATTAVVVVTAAAVIIVVVVVGHTGHQASAVAHHFAVKAQPAYIYNIFKRGDGNFIK